MRGNGSAGNVDHATEYEMARINESDESESLDRYPILAVAQSPQPKSFLQVIDEEYMNPLFGGPQDSVGNHLASG
eukprot:CAMPEP_0202968832 /NCGR_PEP_ID=MMETSP1396-20130829/14296_1 /ASSEMBLY_ACC=CAM_ASM_000872 /TAXON_ID= /ORGANISM="Pseudokeronopsis sp., Strain Brazil" /LENGTH=74 /DNA_ID=CAMNT_0049695609 /DNA_START=84 /DNA_END=304 /DNA_ORIENTATION=-